MSRRRLDAELVHRGLAPSRAAARNAIEQSQVLVAGIPATKPATLVDGDAELRLIAAGPGWASRGALKLDGALDVFGVEVAGRSALDVGASTGGFTDVLLRRGAVSVVALDVGYGQLCWRLRTDPRVRVVDRTNFRNVDPAAVGAPFDVVAVDVSFISVGLLAGQLAASGKEGTDYLVLVKPQFEAGRGRVGSGGIVRDPHIRARAIRTAADALASRGLTARGVCRSAIVGAKGNVEFFLHLRPGDGPGLADETIEEVVAA